jgi:hypothetical protein
MIIGNDQKRVFIRGDCKEQSCTAKRGGIVAGNWKQHLLMEI